MNIVAVCALGIIAAALCTVFRQYAKEYSVAVAAVCGCAIAAVCVAAAVPVIAALRDAANVSDSVAPYIAAMLKSVGVCCIAGFASSICSDCGEKSIAEKVELAARVAIALIYSPILLDLLKTAMEMIKS